VPILEKEEWERHELVVVVVMVVPPHWLNKYKGNGKQLV
jgi:hypothetical protein